jgi:hypothetical protein
MTANDSTDNAFLLESGQFEVPPIDARSLESAVIEYDWADWYFRYREGGLTLILQQVEDRLRTDVDAGVALDYLVAKGCSEEDMLWLLSGMGDRKNRSPIPSSIERPGKKRVRDVLGLEPGKLDRVLKSVEKCSREIETINSTVPFAMLLHTRKLGHYCCLPGLLKQYVGLVRHAKRYFGPKPQTMLNIWTARLVKLVKSKIGQPLDTQVASLISATLGKTYTYSDQNTWRQRHYERLADVDPLITLSSSERLERLPSFIDGLPL